MKRSRVVGVLLAIVALLALCCGQGGSVRAQEIPKELRLLCTFDEGLHACRGAVNPFSASGRVSLVPLEGKGGAARFEGHDPVPEGERMPGQKSAMIFDGRNVPADRGTVAFRVRWAGHRHWADGKRTWLAVLVPRVTEGSVELGEEGTGLALIKEKDNALALALYQFHDDRLNHYFASRQSGLNVAEPDAVPLRVPVGDLRREDWTALRIAWDREGGRVWLGVGDKIESAEAKFRKGTFLCLLLGTPPTISYTEERGFDGEMDDLVVDARTPGQDPNAGLVLPVTLPPMARPDTVAEKAVHLSKDPWAAKLESALRTHLKRVLEAQRCGGWAYTVAFPSMLRFLSSKVVVPYSDDYVACSKDQNSAGAAVRLCAAYEALGDKTYLEAADRTGRMLLALQQSAGHWVYGARIAPDTGKVLWTLRPDIGPFEDHVQSHPVLLMWRLHQLTGREEYQRAAEKGVEFILNGQNPNGSWSHHYNIQLKCGQAARGNKNAGEINDYATADQMRIMLLAYRRTKAPKFLAGYLRGADWLLSAFIDKKAKGWAQQYDENNAPIQARHFEPAAVSLSEGISSVPEMLMDTYRLTGDKRYLDPLPKWKAWMLENKIITDREKNTGGWYDYYDIETGRPIRMAERKILPPDPRDVRDGGFTGLLKRLDAVNAPLPTYVPNETSARAALTAQRGGVDWLIQDMDPVMGSWAFDHGPSGKSFSPQTSRALLLCWAVYVHRQLDGQIPWNDRMASLTANDWTDLFCHVLPPADLRQPLTAEEVAQARAIIEKQRAQ